MLLKWKWVLNADMSDIAFRQRVRCKAGLIKNNVWYILLHVTRIITTKRISLLQPGSHLPLPESKRRNERVREIVL